MREAFYVKGFLLLHEYIRRQPLKILFPRRNIVTYISLLKSMTAKESFNIPTKSLNQEGSS